MIGGSIISGFTLPRRARLSSSTRCLAATCPAGSTCCIAQPPQVPYQPQRGVTRCELSCSTSATLPRSKLPRLRRRVNVTVSPVTPPSMKVTLPSTCATPTPSWSIDSMTASVTAALLAQRLHIGERLPRDLFAHRDAVQGVAEGRRVAVGRREAHRADLRGGR